VIRLKDTSKDGLVGNVDVLQHQTQTSRHPYIAPNVLTLWLWNALAMFKKVAGA